LKRERTSQQVIEYPKFAAVHESAFDAVDGSSTGT
jgi:hypothetical protein